MSERTRAWMSKKQQLSQKEQALKAELESISTVVESNGKKILLIAAAAGGIALIGYLGYRSFSKKTGANSPTSSKKKIVIPKKALIGSLVTERLITMAVGYIANKLEQSFQSEERKEKK